MNSSTDEIAFTAFIDILGDEFQWEKGSWDRGSRLVEDCGLDSMGMYELLLLLEEIGCSPDEDDLLSWMTLGDVFDSYRRWK